MKVPILVVAIVACCWSAGLTAQEKQLKPGEGGFGFRSQKLGEKIFVGTDPADLLALFDLMSNDSIISELGLKVEQIEAATKAAAAKVGQLGQSQSPEARKTRMQNPRDISQNWQAIRKATQDAFEELLTPAQVARLRQLAYHVEIARIGLGPALTDGRLGTDVDVAEEQKKELAEEAWQVELELDAAIRQLRETAQKRMLAELSADQRGKAEKLLGKHFRFVDKAQDTDLVKELAAKRRADAAKTK